VANAIKFSFENSVIEVNLDFVSGMVHVSVKDTGMGIPERNKQYIFDMFTQAKVPGTSGEMPYGLGLSISLQIAKAHHGNIWFESTEGKGSTFHFEFPAKSGG
jgi:signal transduction histidine kinase